MKPLIYIYGTPEYIEQQTCVNYRDALVAAGAEVLHSSNPADGAGCCGLLLPGGGDMDPAYYGQENRGSNPPDVLRDTVEMQLVKEFLKQGKPIFGVCRGAQVLNVALGGTLIQHMEGHRQIENGENLWMRHGAAAEPGSAMERLLGSKLTVNSSHHQAIEVPGEGLRVTMRAEDGTIEAVEHTALPVLATQWHPERMTGSWAAPGLTETAPLFAHFVSLCAKAQEG